MNTYLLLNIGTLIFPFLLSFDKRVAFFRTWLALFPAILIAGGVFLIWDEWFTEMGVWGFNPEYLVGIYGGSLPLEEWLFFLTVPYACVFVYACLNHYVKKDILGPIARPVFGILSIVLIVLGIIFYQRIYTMITFFALSGWILMNLFVWKPHWLGRFLLGYLVSLIPFLMVNGVLTALPIVWYNNAENLALRLGTIPVEDTMYMMLLLMMNVNIYEWLLARRKRTSLQMASTSA
ncbi:MAG: lycopene cyclase domain-containing protein [Bacteroidia bacterium]|nr:lycopene cyclase domain-containing protein [Bacteroidia bacterium]